MAPEFVWLRHEFPWLRRGFLHAVADDYADEFAHQLERRGFRVLRMAPRDASEMFQDLGRLFQFPDYYGGSGWDAVCDCFSDVKVPTRGALFWESAADFASRDPKAFGEACRVLSELFEQLGTDGKQLEIVLVGEGINFSRP